MTKSDLKGLKWLNANEKELNKFAGRWIAFLEKKGVISSGSTLREALRKAKNTSSSPYVFKVPSLKEMKEQELPLKLGHPREGVSSRR